MAEAQIPPSKAFVFGVSGATWDIARPLMARGLLPHLQRLCDTGCSGTLLSVRTQGDKHFRPQTAWAALATGCNPERNGVTEFYHTAEEYRVPTLWHHFRDAGRRVGMYYWCISWPVTPVDGFMIPCYHSRDGATWPPDLGYIKHFDRRQTEALRGAAPSVSVRLRDALTNASALVRSGVQMASLPAILDRSMRAVVSRSAEERRLFVSHVKAELSADAFLKLYRRAQPHLATYTSFLVDLVSHRYWRYHDPAAFGEPTSGPGARLHAALEEAYVETDRLLGRILSQIDPSTVVFVVSEHGMAPEPVSAEVGSRQFVIQPTDLAELVGLRGDLIGVPIARWIAYRPRPGQPLPEGTAERFRAIRVVETGLPLFNVHTRGPAEVVVKLNLSREVPRYAAADLEHLTLEYEGRKVPFTQVTRAAGRQRSAMHTGEAMWVVQGPGIRRGVALPDARITDVTPTLLQAVGLGDRGAVFDGHVVDAVFDRPASAAPP